MSEPEQTMHKLRSIRSILTVFVLMITFVILLHGLIHIVKESAEEHDDWVQSIITVCSTYKNEKGQIVTMPQAEFE